MPLSVSFAAYEALHADLLDAWHFTSLGDMFHSPSRAESWHLRLTSVGYALLAGEDFQRDEQAHGALLRLTQILIGRLELCWSHLSPTPLVPLIERTLLSLGPDSTSGTLGIYRRELEPFVTSPFRTLGHSVQLACATLPKMSAPFFWTRDFRDLRFIMIFDAKLRSRWLRVVLEALPSELRRTDINIPRNDWVRIAGRLRAVLDSIIREVPRYRLSEPLRAILDSVTRRAANKTEPVQVVLANRTSRFVRGRGRPQASARSQPPIIDFADRPSERMNLDGFEEDPPSEVPTTSTPEPIPPSGPRWPYRFATPERPPSRSQSLSF
ncbi:hypothetical protein CVT24_005627 [Panaeolus cyanescens]|uniref:Uncharacterized protein n=1 Tax=Panaeolus cyanescens TaxID=181874 RepID=A0A409X4X7_9AGAR|nr:hypothetical protein CVT24_005627 [Panaeolus cyanescens]